MTYVSYSDSNADIIDYCRNLNIGDKIKFVKEKQRYTVQAKSDRFLICTKPFNAKKTYLYTIIDLERYVRGAVGLVFGLVDEVNNPLGATECIKDLEEGKYEVSHRNCIRLDVEFPN